MTSNHQFTVTVEGADLLAEAHLDALFEAGCDDASFGFCDGVQEAAFRRVAPSFAEAVASAIHAIESTVPGARVVAIVRDDAALVAG